MTEETAHIAQMGPVGMCHTKISEGRFLQFAISSQKTAVPSRADLWSRSVRP